MRLLTCPDCWDNPCMCGGEARRGTAIAIAEGVDLNWKFGDPPTRLKPGGSFRNDAEYKAHWGDAAFEHFKRYEEERKADPYNIGSFRALRRPAPMADMKKSPDPAAGGS